MEQPLLLIGRPRTSSWPGGRAVGFSASVSAVSSFAGCGGMVVQVNSLTCVDWMPVSSFSMGMFGGVVAGVSVISGDVLVTVTETAGVPGAVCEKEGTVT